ncbi:ABC transporter substrate-binding protein [Actinophytocola oryzae]|uniref:Amino acid/amide ABC transporter substrate-binding protein (HAAT family) n=1 Tax=Actinophytocola oryzae TaxID=502181 RepID=A0A4R7UUW7_9PSEU|nr:ABC transporter substrate-binding protein [Actinophytocola oryzae]TDV39712.1 amino acid/amide ABC transporter substrate-binding protein (HAAT family) [Actinophytocola oryzae]
MVQRVLPGRVLAAVTVVAVLGVPACTVADAGPGAPDVTEIRIGTPLPLSGPNAALGKDALRAAQLAAEVVNNGLPGLTLPPAGEKGVPNLGHAKLAIVSADTQGSAETGASVVDDLVNGKGVDILAGGLDSEVTSAEAQAAERLRVPFVASVSSSPDLTQQGLKWFFRTGPTDITYAQPFFGLLADEKAATIALLYTNDAFGSEAANVARSLAQANGRLVVADVPFDPSATDLVPQLRNIQGARPDAVLVAADAPATTLFAAAAAQLDYLPPAVLASGAGFADSGADLDGMSRRVAWSEDLGSRNPAAKLVADEYEKRYHAPFTENAAQVFTTIMAVARAFDDAGSVEPDAVRAALVALDIPGRDTIMPWDGIRFDDRHQNTGARAVVEQRLNGQWKVVYPKDVRAREIVWPAAEARG